MKREYVEPPTMNRPLRYGDTGRDVKYVQTILQREGFFDGTPLGNFYTQTLDALRYFQGTHIGKDGEFLEVDGMVGEETWWALHNPHGSAQRNGIPVPEGDGKLATPPSVSEEDRLAFVRFMYGLYAKGVREVPDGSNYGDGVTPIVNACGFAYGIAWCMAAVSYGFKEALGRKPLGAMFVGCSDFWNAAHAKGYAHPKGTYTPCPGDVGIYNYGAGLLADGRLRGAGHATTVVRVDAPGKRHNAIEGNAGNRLKHSIRAEADRRFVGYVNLFGDAHNPPHGLFPAGVTPAPKLELTLAGSR